MVSTSTIIGVIFTLIISLFLPVILIIIYAAKNKGKKVWSAWLFGALGFFIMQIVIRLPILSVLSLNDGFLNFVENHYIIYCLALAFTAGLFEVIARYVVAKIMQKNLTFERGIAAGLGHGGIEAMILIGLTYINNLVYIFMINSNTFDTLISQTEALGVDASGLVDVKNQLINTSSLMFYLGGYERILTIIFHVALSLLVCYFVKQKKDWLGIVICLILHTIVDFSSVTISGLSTDYLGNKISQNAAYIIVYAVLTIVAIGSFVLIKYIKKKWYSLEQDK